MALTLPARGGCGKIPAWGHQLVLVVQLSDRLAHIPPCFSVTNTLGHARWGAMAVCPLHMIYHTFRTAHRGRFSAGCVMIR